MTSCDLKMKDSIKTKAFEVGFDAVGFAPARLPEAASQGLAEFIAAGHHGQMRWMEERMAWRADPAALWPEARSVIMLGHNYGPSYDPMGKLLMKDRGVISAYALNLDYHDIIKKKLKTLARWLTQAHGGDVKVFVDTAPVMEKPLAAQAGIGWQGKHTCIVSREFGSWLFLGSVFSTLEIAPDAPEPNHCGSCSACLDICPTQAFVGPGKLDARRCIAYLTIEHDGPIPEEFREAMGNRVYGCDDCLAVCPWNKFAQASHEAGYHARAALDAPRLAELAMLDDAAFRVLFAKSPIKRIGRDRFVRNVCIAAGNSGEAELLPLMQKLSHDDSAQVADSARWAMMRLGAGNQRA